MIPIEHLENAIISPKNNNFDQSYLKRYNLLILCSIIKQQFTEGNIIEIGVGAGETTAYLRNYFNENFNLFIYDSFEGLSEPTTDDLLGNFHVVKGNLCYRLDYIKHILNQNCTNKNIEYIQGWVDDTIPKNLPNDICFAHIDVDLYEPTYHSLKHVIPKMKKNGVIIVDDYDDPVWIGPKKACDKIETELNVRFVRLNIPNSVQYQAVLQII
jgi:predicted O-methyltransferase YrrM